MKPWRVAMSLDKLRKQLNELAPNRSKASDGSIGNQEHRERVSDHNPNDNGVVTAIDVTHDPSGGMDCNWLAAALVHEKDSRVKYVIWNARIARSYPHKGSPAWAWKPYAGTNAHRHHLHVSVNEVNCDLPTRWALEDDLAVADPPTTIESAAIPPVAMGLVDTAQPVLVQKPTPQNFMSRIKNKIAGLTGANFGLQTLREYMDQVRALNLSQNFWFWVTVIATVGSLTYLAIELFKYRSEVKRDLALTSQLVTANTTPTNTVGLANFSDPKTAQELQDKGYKLVTR